MCYTHIWCSKSMIYTHYITYNYMYMSAYWQVDEHVDYALPTGAHNVDIKALGSLASGWTV